MNTNTSTVSKVFSRKIPTGLSELTLNPADRPIESQMIVSALQGAFNKRGFNSLAEKYMKMIKVDGNLSGDFNKILERQLKESHPGVNLDSPEAKKLKKDFIRAHTLDILIEMGINISETMLDGATLKEAGKTIEVPGLKRLLEEGVISTNQKSDAALRTDLLFKTSSVVAERLLTHAKVNGMYQLQLDTSIPIHEQLMISEFRDSLIKSELISKICQNAAEKDPEVKQEISERDKVVKQQLNRLKKLRRESR